MKPMIHIASATAVVLAMAYASLNCEAQQEGVPSQAAERMDELRRTIKYEVANATDSVRHRFSATRERLRGDLARTQMSAREIVLANRIYARLHWDKSLHFSIFTLEAGDNAIVVRGIVPDEATRAKALRLVDDTVGVSRVVDQLEIDSSSATIVDPTNKRYTAD